MIHTAVPLLQRVTDMQRINGGALKLMTVWVKVKLYALEWILKAIRINVFTFSQLGWLKANRTTLVLIKEPNRGCLLIEKLQYISGIFNVSQVA